MVPPRCRSAPQYRRVRDWQRFSSPPSARDSVSHLAIFLPTNLMGVNFLTLGALSFVMLGIAVASAQHAPASGPPPSAVAPGNSTMSPSPGAATDCYIGNGTACVYSFGQCSVDADCDAVLAASLAAYSIGEPPSDAAVVCYMFKCDLATPSTACASDLSLPVCGAAASAPVPASSSASLPAAGRFPQSPASAPASGPRSPPIAYAPQPPPQAVFPALCGHAVLNTGRGCCVEFGGSCQTFSDCIPSIAAFLLALPDHLSAPPSDSLPACYAGRCYYASESTNCSVLGPPLSPCTDGYMCEYSTANESYVSPPPAVNVHRIIAPAAPAPPLGPPPAAASTFPSQPPSPPPTLTPSPPLSPPSPASTAAHSAQLSFLFLILAIVAIAAAP